MNRKIVSLIRFDLFSFMEVKLKCYCANENTGKSLVPLISVSLTSLSIQELLVLVHIKEVAKSATASIRRLVFLLHLRYWGNFYCLVNSVFMCLGYQNDIISKLFNDCFIHENIKVYYSSL